MMPAYFQQHLMRQLCRQHAGNEDAIVSAYAEAERNGLVAREENTHELTPEQYARALYQDGMRKGWITSDPGEMDALCRGLVEKAGYDNGWEVVKASGGAELQLASALHPAVAHIARNTDGTYRLRIAQTSVHLELCRACGLTGNEESIQASDLPQLGALLRRGAQLARALPTQPEETFHKALERELAALPSSTEVERMVRQRVGQEIFRDSLLDYWRGACAVTGIAQPELLRASHIRPWADCESDADRLNVFNGLLLTANLDALFDRGLMTFDADGKAVYSPRLDGATRAALGLDDTLSLRWIAEEHVGFLRHHWKRFGFELAPVPDRLKPVR